MKKDFAHLHLHSMYSILDSIIKIGKVKNENEEDSKKVDTLVDRVKELGMSSVAITDHGVASGLIQLITFCEKSGIKPLPGVEFYLSPTEDHTLREKLEDTIPYYHITCLAMNADGVRQLYKLSSIGFTEGFYYKPRIAPHHIEEIGKDLIVLSGCFRGPVAHNILHGKSTEAEKYIKRFKESFPGRFFLEAQFHGEDDQKIINQLLVEYEKKYDLKIVPTNDAHFLRKEDHDSHSIMMCLQLRKTMPELKEAGMIYSTECYVKSREEMSLIFGEELCDRTLEVADMIDVKMEFGKPIFPKVDLELLEAELDS